MGSQPLPLVRTSTKRGAASAPRKRAAAESYLARSVCMRRVLTWPSIYTDAYETFEDEAKAHEHERKSRQGSSKVPHGGTETPIE